MLFLLSFLLCLQLFPPQITEVAKQLSLPAVRTHLFFRFLSACRSAAATPASAALSPPPHDDGLLFCREAKTVEVGSFVRPFVRSFVPPSISLLSRFHSHCLRYEPPLCFSPFSSICSLTPASLSLSSFSIYPIFTRRVSLCRRTTPSFYMRLGNDRRQTD